MKEFVMVDLESLGTKNDAVILEIGAVRFDMTGIGETYFSGLAWTAQSDRRIDPDTLNWWLGQENFRDVLSGGGDLITSLFELVQFMHGATKFHAKGDFDYRILEHAMEQNGIRVPWRYSQIRDYRSIQDIAEYAGIIQAKKNNHSALDDAVNQARTTVEFMRWLREKR